MTRFCFNNALSLYFPTFLGLRRNKREREKERKKEVTQRAPYMCSVRRLELRVCSRRERQIGVKGEEAGRALVAWKQGRAKHTLWQRGIPHSASEDVRSFTLSRGAARREPTSVTSVS